VDRVLRDLFATSEYRPHGTPLGFGSENEKQIIDPTNITEMTGALEIIAELARLDGWMPHHEFNSSGELFMTSVTDPTGKVEVMTDSGHSQLELVYVPFTDLNAFAAFSRSIMDVVVGAARRASHVVIGVGRHPVVGGASRFWVDKPRYEAVRKSLTDGGSETLSTAGAQLTVDTWCETHLMATLNCGVALAGLIGAPFANSSVFGGARHDRELASRLRTWERISREPRRIGMPLRPFTSLGDYLYRIFSLPYMLHVFPGKRKDAARFGGTVEEAIAHYGDEEFARIIACHTACCWLDARVRMNRYRCVELRVPCAQKDHRGDVACSAYQLGLATNALSIWDDFASEIEWDQLTAARGSAADVALDGFVGKRTMLEACRDLQVLVDEGIHDRGQGEGLHLDPVRETLDAGITPADELLEIFGAGGDPGVERIIDRRGFVLSSEMHEQAPLELIRSA